MRFILHSFLSALLLSSACLAQSLPPMCSFTNNNDPNACCHSHGCTSQENGKTCALTPCISQQMSNVTANPKGVAQTSTIGIKSNSAEKATNNTSDNSTDPK